MKVCILGIDNIKHMTLISVYSDYFDKKGIPYDIIYINKDKVAEKTSAVNMYGFETEIKTKIDKYKTILEFKQYAEDIMTAQKYDFIVVWREQTAAVFSHYLKKYYKHRYSVNIRDLWNARNLFISYGVKTAVNYSAFNTISSERFLEFIPKSNYIMLHSVNRKVVNLLKKREYKENDAPIVVTYLGAVRFIEYCKYVIDIFGNDTRFLIKYIGNGAESIKEYVDEKGYCNVVCEGKFDSELTTKLIQDADIINCAFGATGRAELCLTPIRFYYALYMDIPVLTTAGSWVDDLSRKLSMNLTIPNARESREIASFSTQIYNAYRNLDRNKMYKEMDKYRREISNTNFQLDIELDNCLRL